jgi:hypothetical protein
VVSILDDVRDMFLSQVSARRRDMEDERLLKLSAVTSYVLHNSTSRPIGLRSCFKVWGEVRLNTLLPSHSLLTLTIAYMGNLLEVHNSKACSSHEGRFKCELLRQILTGDLTRISGSEIKHQDGIALVRLGDGHLHAYQNIP